MKRLKGDSTGHPYCTFCPEKTVKAVYREDGFASIFACREHKAKLLDIELERQNFSATDADRATWMKL